MKSGCWNRLNENLQNWDYTVPVVNCQQREYDAQARVEMKFDEYLAYWNKKTEKSCSEQDNDCLYLKDWHLQRESHDSFYEVPHYFRSDWLNEFLDEKNMDDYRFTYMGPKGSWTPFHADVFGSYSWSANVCGRKLWFLVPRGDEELLRDSKRQLPYDLRNCSKNLAKVWIEVIQEEGEVIFVPSGWYHQVINLEDTISINHNWFNGANIHHVITKLLEGHNMVCQELHDCRPTNNLDQLEWRNQCELVLKCHHGMNLKGFRDLLITIGEKRLDSKKTSFLIHFDLKKIEECLFKLIESKEISEIVEIKKIEVFLKRIDDAIQM
ncbi:2-oxoglutarate and iron-dependent oxygenase JMJD4-like isoform X2 [Artemia franciscana]|uniref:2-oxoglutarate and iron-dependent oxygenase JMJD4-like isoform X2 n=1 Tax=Artemia franciscana TaxID=6661 RepID=UPI0032DB0D4B